MIKVPLISFDGGIKLMKKRGMDDSFKVTSNVFNNASKYIKIALVVGFVIHDVFSITYIRRRGTGPRPNPYLYRLTGHGCFRIEQILHVIGLL
jgi:hypothetical protein